MRAALSHIRTYINPLLGEIPLKDLNVREHQTFITQLVVVSTEEKLRKMSMEL